MPRVLLVNNFPNTAVRWHSMLAESLKESGADLRTCGFLDSSARRFAQADGVVLSGSFSMLSKNATATEYSSEIEAVKDCSTPLLGICFGHQLLGYAFGSPVVRGAEPTSRYVEARLRGHDPLFLGLSRRTSLYESHYEQLAEKPRGFDLLSTSPRSSVNAMKHRRRPLYGVQFHPERHSRTNPGGGVVLANFVRMLS